jgi:hypothetical protein
VAGWCSAEGACQGTGCWRRSPVRLPGCHPWRQETEQQRRCTLPIGRTWSRAGGSACSSSFPTSPWRWAHALQCAGRHPPAAPHLPGLPFLLLCCCGGRNLGRKSPGGGGQGKSKGWPGFYTSELGLGEATDGDDHRHPCPWPRGAHPAGRARCGAGDAPPVLFDAGSAHGHREEKGE